MKGALKGWKKQARPAIMANDLPEFLTRLVRDPSEEMTKLGIMLTILTWLRSAESRGGLWNEINFEKREWIVPASRRKMKDREDHFVPLSFQAVRVLERLNELAGKSPLIFSGRNNPQRVMSENTMTYALHAMGYRNKATGHGFRATASTIVNESGLFNPDAIERQLAHSEKDLIRAACHRAEYLEERRRTMDWWGVYRAVDESNLSHLMTFDSGS
jgi:integrase